MEAGEREVQEIFWKFYIYESDLDRTSINLSSNICSILSTLVGIIKFFVILKD